MYRLKLFLRPVVNLGTLVVRMISVIVVKLSSRQRVNICLMYVSTHIILRQHHFTPDSVILAIRLRVVPKVSYPGILSSWNLKEVEKLDQMLGIVYRTVTKNLPSFPKALLHISRLRGGLGLPSLWAHINTGKDTAVSSGLYG